MKSRHRVVLRADSSKFFGYGHVYRLLALAEIIRANFDCLFVTVNPDDFIKQQISIACDNKVFIEKGISGTDPNSDLLSVSSDLFELNGIIEQNDIVVLDGYQFDENYREEIKKAGCKLIIIDDYYSKYSYADIIINHAPVKKNEILKSAKNYFLGLKFAILRTPFFSPIVQRSSNLSVAYVSIGGSDNLSFTLKLCTYLTQSNLFDKIHVLCSNQFSPLLVSQLKVLSNNGMIFLHFNLSGDKIVELLDECTHAFVSASTVLMESYSRGLLCFTGYYIDNQYKIYKGFVENELAVGLGSFSELTYDELYYKIKNAKIEKLKISLKSFSNINQLFLSI